MGGIIWFIIVVIIIVNISKQKNNTAKKTSVPNVPQRTEYNRTTTRSYSSNEKMSQSEINAKKEEIRNSLSNVGKEIKKEIQKEWNLNSGRETSNTPKPNYSYTTSAKKEETILDRAKKNTEALEQDSLHDAQCGTKKDTPIMHSEPKQDFDTASSIGDIEDLMIKGYCGTMEFERDFLGEAMDMINSYTL